MWQNEASEKPKLQGTLINENNVVSIYKLLVTHTHTHTHTYIYIYIYRERERERELPTQVTDLI
jgi:hypothetical protein